MIKKIFMTESKNRSLTFNIVLCITSFILFFILPSYFYIILLKIFKSEMLCEILARLFSLVTIGSFYFKDFVNEFKKLKNKFGYKLGQMFKYYGIGLGVMIFSNLILLIIFKDISTNETQVREILLSNPVAMMLVISILGPVIEEITFRKSLSPLFKNNYVFAIVSGLLFGLAHLMTDFTSGNFQIFRLLYVIPYGSLGFSFALMNRKCESTFASIGIHCMHNFLTGLLVLSQGGLL